jgi:hypothetical protein
MVLIKKNLYFERGRNRSSSFENKLTNNYSGLNTKVQPVPFASLLLK